MTNIAMEMVHYGWFTYEQMWFLDSYVKLPEDMAMCDITLTGKLYMFIWVPWSNTGTPTPVKSIL